MLLTHLGALLKNAWEKKYLYLQIFIHVVSGFRYQILVVLEESLFFVHFRLAGIFFHHCHLIRSHGDSYFLLENSQILHLPLLSETQLPWQSCFVSFCKSQLVNTSCLASLNSLGCQMDLRSDVLPFILDSALSAARTYMCDFQVTLVATWIWILSSYQKAWLLFHASEVLSQVIPFLVSFWKLYIWHNHVCSQLTLEIQIMTVFDWNISM